MSLYVDIEKKLGSFHLKVCFQADNETLALLGASGCGKSLTLKCIAGIEKPDRGKILLDGIPLFDSEKKINLTPQQRKTGLMFQNYALFPNMTVLENIQCGANREADKRKRGQAVAEVIGCFGLEELKNRYPHQLSGGQQQRVALARILVSDPGILLLDEPFSALDSHLRFRLEQEVRQVIRRFGKTVLLVSHDRDEVFRLADSIAVMDAGNIQAIGSKREVFSDPQTCKGALLTGCKNVSSVQRLPDGRLYAQEWGIALEAEDNREATALGIRMHDIRPGGGKNTILCQVVEEIENPFSYTILLRPIGREDTVPLGWEMDKSLWQERKRDTVEICLPPENLLLLKH